MKNNVDYITYHYIMQEGKADYLDMKVVTYSYDNVTWSAFPKKGLSLAESETVYVRLEEVDRKEIPFYATNAKASDIEW